MMQTMLREMEKLHPWMAARAAQTLGKLLRRRAAVTDLVVCVCDHYEPLWRGADDAAGRARVEDWVRCYPAIAGRHRDSSGRHPKHTFFYPAEEYRPALLDLLAGLCRDGWGEVEVHLHHDNDTAGGLHETLRGFTRALHGRHGLLAVERATGALRYGFIHGNWALDNAHPRGRYCGVAGELCVLQATGCYADFTLPSAPDATQTVTINSIYYAAGAPGRSKAHERGVRARVGSRAPGLLLVQGPLVLDWRRRKAGVLPRIENGGIDADLPARRERIGRWISAGVHVRGKPGCVFVKLHTHGCQERTREYLLGGGLDDLYGFLEEYCAGAGVRLHYASARETVNIICGIEDNASGDIGQLREYRLLLRQENHGRKDMPAAYAARC